MYSFRQLSGHTLWTGPVLLKGVNLSFSMRVVGDSPHGRIIDAILEKNGRQSMLTPKWCIDLSRSGVSIFTNGQGLPGQLRNVMSQIEGFNLRPMPFGFILTATLRDDPTSEGLRWDYVLSSLDVFQRDELFVSEPLVGGTWPTRTFGEVYPVVIAVSA